MVAKAPQSTLFGAVWSAQQCEGRGGSAHSSWQRVSPSQCSYCRVLQSLLPSQPSEGPCVHQWNDHGCSEDWGVLLQLPTVSVSRAHGMCLNHPALSQVVPALISWHSVSLEQVSLCGSKDRTTLLWRGREASWGDVTAAELVTSIFWEHKENWRWNQVVNTKSLWLCLVGQGCAWVSSWCFSPEESRQVEQGKTQQNFSWSMDYMSGSAWCR